MVLVCEGPDIFGDPYDMFYLERVEIPGYRSVDWLIDNTPLRKPLFVWADFWGVGNYFELEHWDRTH